MVVTPTESFGFNVVTTGNGLAEFAGFFLVLRNGTILRTIYWDIIKLCFAVVLVGVFLKIQHYPFSDIVLATGLLGVAITYAIRFLNKKQKMRSDVIKLLWVMTAYVGAVLFLLHLVPKEVMYASAAVLWLVILDFIITGFYRKTIFLK